MLRRVLDQTEYSDCEDLSKDTVLLDVCCGTGTIGLSLAGFVRSVIGLDVCEQAIDDAKDNARLNGWYSGYLTVLKACMRQSQVVEHLLSIVRGAGVFFALAFRGLSKIAAKPVILSI